MTKILNTIGDRYILHKKLGQGGMGAVYRATDRLTQEIVALKQIARVNLAIDQSKYRYKRLVC